MESIDVWMLVLTYGFCLGRRALLDYDGLGEGWRRVVLVTLVTRSVTLVVQGCDVNSEPWIVIKLLE